MLCMLNLGHALWVLWRVKQTSAALAVGSYRGIIRSNRLRVPTEKMSVAMCICAGMLNLIDLAGSERLKTSSATGDRLKETQAINKSLSALGTYIQHLHLAASSTAILHTKHKMCGSFLVDYVFLKVISDM